MVLAACSNHRKDVSEPVLRCSRQNLKVGTERPGLVLLRAIGCMKHTLLLSLCKQLLQL